MYKRALLFYCVDFKSDQSAAGTLQGNKLIQLISRSCIYRKLLSVDQNIVSILDLWRFNMLVSSFTRFCVGAYFFQSEVWKMKNRLS